jgi:pyridoxine 5-phosphate synthase
MAEGLRLGLNIDHVATIRNARGGAHPDPARAAAMAYEAGADGLTIHLREDRRHIRDGDLDAIRLASPLPINLEMAATEEMCAIATAFKPHAACIVPEKREERTTEGGLDVAGQHNMIAPIVRELAEAGIARLALHRTRSGPDRRLRGARRAGRGAAHRPLCRAVAGRGEQAAADELERLRRRRSAARAGLEPHAGHGLTYDNVKPIAAIPEIAELNIGHFLIGEAIFTGLPSRGSTHAQPDG